jgi:hypothetical protein
MHLQKKRQTERITAATTKAQTLGMLTTRLKQAMTSTLRKLCCWENGNNCRSRQPTHGNRSAVSTTLTNQQL